MRRIQELMQRNADGEDEREHFEPVEGPAEVRGGERLPLGAVKRAIPGRRGGGGEFSHHLLPNVASYLECVCVAYSVCSPPPCGEGLGVGVVGIARTTSSSTPSMFDSTSLFQYRNTR